MNQDKDFKTVALKTVARGVRTVAEISSGSRCLFFLYEPKIPEALKFKKAQHDYKDKDIEA